MMAQKLFHVLHCFLAAVRNHCAVFCAFRWDWIPHSTGLATGLHYVCNGGTNWMTKAAILSIYHSTHPQPAGVVYLNTLQELYSFTCVAVLDRIENQILLCN